MTDATPLASEQITQEDREAAVRLLYLSWKQQHGNVVYGWMCDEEGATLAGKRDQHWAVQYAAQERHRIAALSATPAPSGQGVSVPEGMKAWAGGECAPDDWDGGGVVLRNGSTMFPSKVSLVYHANGTNRWNHERPHRNPDVDIIAYTPKDGGQGVSVPEGMKPWAGGDNAPDDWDGGEVLLNNGELGDGNVWDHHPSRDTRIIAYTPLTAPAPSCAPGEVERALSALDRFVTDHIGNDDTSDGIAVDEAAQAALATLRAALSPQGLDAKEGGE